MVHILIYVQTMTLKPIICGISGTEISESIYSEDLKFIMNTIRERNKKAEDYSSPDI
jgi:hypothetical protein